MREYTNEEIDCILEMMNNTFNDVQRLVLHSISASQAPAMERTMYMIRATHNLDKLVEKLTELDCE